LEDGVSELPDDRQRFVSGAGSAEERSSCFGGIARSLAGSVWDVEVVGEGEALAREF
jgi:hypothetical protein